MSSRALTLALRLLTTACAGAALGTLTGCPLLFACPDPWSEVTTVELGTDADIFAITGGGDYDQRVAVGRGGVVVHYDSSGDGEASSISNPTNVDLRGVVGGAATLVVGDAGTILSSDDGGLTWIARDSGVSDDLLAIVYAQLTIPVHVAVAADQVLYSTDGGVTWLGVAAPAAGWGGLRAAFFSGSRVFVVGDNGTAWSSDDPAGAWLAEPLATTEALLGGGRVSGDESSTYASGIAVATRTQVWFREADATEWTAVEAAYDGDIVAFGGGFVVTSNGTVYDIDERGFAERIANVGLTPRTINGGWDGFMVAGEGGNAARAYFQECVGGRPWVIDGEHATAKIVRTSAWVAGRELALPNELDPSLRELLATAWGRDAQFEHASIASFARVSVELLRFGAPPDLIAATRRAILDEIEHARGCFALASRYAGRPLGAGPLPLPCTFDPAITPADLAVALFEDGCVNESVAAAEAAVAASECQDPEVRATLQRIAADEREHAALAWRTLRWLLDGFGHEVAPALRRQIVSLGAPLTRSPLADRGDPRIDQGLREHGRLPAEDRANIHRKVFAELIVPLSRELLGASARALA